MLFLIWGYVLSRLGWKFLKMWRNAHDIWGFILLGGKALIWVGVLGIYTKILLFSQPDWWAQPGFIQGSVQGITYDSGSKLYVLEIRSGPERKQFYVDRNIYEQLKMEDQVKLRYLPIRREVVRCELVGN